MLFLKYVWSRIEWYLAYFFNFSHPTHVDIEMSSACHLECEMCFRPDAKIEAAYFDKEEAEDIIKQCRDAGVKSIKFNWRGEALLNFDTCYLIGVAKRAGLITYLNTSLSSELSAYQLGVLAECTDVLKVSFDSTVEPIYEQIRKGADYDKTLFNLERLFAYRSNYNKKKIIISRRHLNIEMEPDSVFKKFFKDKGWKAGFDIRPAMKRNKKDIFKKNKNKERRYCGHPSRRLVISTSGDTYVCCVAYDENAGLCVGNINNSPLLKHWNSPKRLNIVEHLRENKILWDSCKNCTSKDAYK
jgi:radical SAM protein with 4Fe4S-binding SPASM domain